LQADRRNDIQAFGELMVDVFGGSGQGDGPALPDDLTSIIERCRQDGSTRAYASMQAVSSDLDRL